MPIPRIEVLDDYALGQLIIDWATNKKPRPQNLEEFRQQTVHQGILAELPTYIKAFAMVQAHQEVLLMRLPPKELVEDTLSTLGNPDAYALAKFYRQSLCPPESRECPIPPLDKERFFRLRVGDYTIAHCT